jgi:hypothetical protein
VSRVFENATYSGSTPAFFAFWRAPGKRGSEAGRKGGKLQGDAVIPSSKWLWRMTNEGLVEASSGRTC